MEALRNVASVATNITSKTVTTVGSGLQAINPVTAVNRLRRRGSAGPAGELDEEVIAAQCKVQSSLTVKSCPSKNAPTTNALSVRSGILMKRNAQGVWVSRFVCTVPHMFLYYYDSDSSDSPRGIIDMHLYNSLTIEGAERNILKLSPPPEAGAVKPYYFQGDPEVLNQWMTSIHRDRYEVVRDERDAYQQLQEQFSGEIENITKELDATNEDRERLRSELAAVRSGLDDALLRAHGILSELGLSQHDVNLLADLPSALSAMLETTRRADREKSLRNREMDQLLAGLEGAVRSKETLASGAEARLLAERREWEMRSREQLAEAEKASMIAKNTCSEMAAVEQRNSKLGDEKKVLIKEVKQLRKKVEEMQEEAALAVTQRREMEARQVELLDQLRALQQDLWQRQRASPVTAISADGSSSSESTSDVSGANPLGLSLGETETACTGDGVVLAVIREDDRDSFAATPRISDVNQWEVPTGRLQDLYPVYVSIDSNAECNSSSSPASNVGSPSSVFSGFVKSGLSMFGGTDSGRTVTISTTLEKQLLMDERNSSGSGTEGAAEALGSARTVGDAVDAANELPPSDGTAKIKCLRCDGTVEGPKYSTCTCRVPVLNPGFPAGPLAAPPQGRWPSLGLMKLAKDIIPGINGIAEEE